MRQASLETVIEPGDFIPGAEVAIKLETADDVDAFRYPHAAVLQSAGEQRQ